MVLLHHVVEAHCNLPNDEPNVASAQIPKYWVGVIPLSLKADISTSEDRAGCMRPAILWMTLAKKDTDVSSA